jgi:hypothetical protein
MAYPQPSGSFLHATLYRRYSYRSAASSSRPSPSLTCRRISAASWIRKRGTCCFRPSGRWIRKASQSSFRSRCRRKLVGQRLQRGRCSGRSRQKGSGQGSTPKGPAAHTLRGGLRHDSHRVVVRRHASRERWNRRRGVGQDNAPLLVLGQGFLVGLPAGWARADITGVGCRTSYEPHWFPAVRTRHLLGHFRFHGAPFIGPNGVSASPSWAVLVWRVSDVLRPGATFAWPALAVLGRSVPPLGPSAGCPAARTSWSFP